MSGSPFWNFSLAVYSTKGVPDACIRLQDQSLVDVNVLLYLLWLARQGRQLSMDEVKAIVTAIDPWRRDVVVPLRTARRALKEPPALLGDQATEALRNKVKAVELEAERLQQEALFAYQAVDEIGREATTVRRAAMDNLAHYAGVLGTRFDATARDSVIDAALAKAAGGPGA